MPGRHFLFVPGPTHVPDRVQRAMHRAMVDHRSSAFPDLPLSIFRDLAVLFRTASGRPFVFAATGTGMWEAALTNTLSPGDRILSLRYGQFSHNFADAARRLGYRVDQIEIPWGEGADPTRIEEALTADVSREIRAVLVVHNETSTGVCSDIAAVRRAIDSARHPALLFVDGVSSIGSLEFRMDDWNVDIAITGSQKGLMLPPGLGILCARERALERIETARSPRAYFDFRDQLRHNAGGYFPYTPPLSLLFGLREALDMLLEEGLDAVVARHHRLAEGVRRAVAAWGLSLCARSPRWHSDTVTAIMTPPGIDGATVIDIAFRRYDLSLGAGLGDVVGKLFRIGHLGDLNVLMILGALAGVEMAMSDAGIEVEPGSGVAAAETWYRES
ncbi:MAG TPA: aminotransferase class V-fold PLP-dependent enzyme [Gemmatimonadaceae bacterium]|nr:aminotransferase class V-fold PLP-dependent enzyme [Gemmatimonadaceae bacterium]